MRTFNGSPALNVKVYNISVTTEQIMQEFGCTEAVAEKALGFAFESAQFEFWENIHDLASFILDDVNGCVTAIRQEGRMGGWLVVDGLMPVEEWKTRQIKKWAKFQKIVAEHIADRLKWENIRDAIEANEWAREGAELFNFVDTPKGLRCVADLNAALAKTRAEFLGGANNG